MGKLSCQNWRNRMELLIKEQGSRLELLEATVEEQKARLEKLESSPMHSSRQPKNISEIRDALVRVLRVPRKVSESTSAPENEKLTVPPIADSHQKTTASGVVTNPKKITSFRTGTAEVFGKGCPEVGFQLARLEIHKDAAECMSRSEHEGSSTIPFPTSSRQDNDTSTEVVTTPKRNNISSTERLRGETPKSDTTQTVHIPRAGCGNPKSAVKWSSKVNHHRSMKSKDSASQIKSSSAGKRNALADLDSGLHTKDNSEGNRFKCTNCAKTFSCQCSLARHMRVHTGEKPFLCKVCRKQFTQSGSLKIHMRTHTQEKPFLCKVCRKQFTQSGSLKIHMRTHTQEKSFTCGFCRKGFYHVSHLTAHRRIHTHRRKAICLRSL